MKRSAVLGLLLALLGQGVPPGATAQDLPAGLSFGGPFELVDQDGRTRTDTDFRGRFMLVFFGYTFCPDICPLDLSVMADALDRLGPKGELVQPVFVSIDPARDTPAVLKDYVGLFHPRLVGLTGGEPQVRAVARAYRVHRRKVVTDAGRPDDYLVDHGSLAYLMGPDGGFLTLVPHGTDAGRMAEVVASYLPSGAAAAR